jgi:nucleoside-diphosphate-sugar epimerase
MSKNLIVGFTGGIGRATAQSLLNRGEKVIALVRDLNKAERYAAELQGIELRQGDASRLQDVLSASENCSRLFYCANVPYPMWHTHTRELLKISIEAAVKNKLKFIFPGNVYVYGHPQQSLINEGHPHAANTKKGQIRIDMENMLFNTSRESDFTYAIVRFPDFYGPFVINGYYDQIFLNALKGKKINWIGSLKVPQEFIFIEDAGESMVIAGLSGKSNNMMFNVPGFSETTAREFLNEIVKQSGKKSKVSSINIPFLISIAGVFDKLIYEFSEMFYLKRERLILNGALFRSTFGTLPATPYAEGIKKTLLWTREFFKI